MTNKKSLQQVMQESQKATDALLDFVFSFKSINLESNKNERI